MADDGGVLENLPRSRPGRRSAKRSAPSAAKAAAPRGAASSSQREPLVPEPSDPVGDAIRLATSVAAAGAHVANGVARELLRRLPRP
jgi:hypothetical protein